MATAVNLTTLTAMKKGASAALKVEMAREMATITVGTDVMATTTAEVANKTGATDVLQASANAYKCVTTYWTGNSALGARIVNSCTNCPTMTIMVKFLDVSGPP